MIFTQNLTEINRIINAEHSDPHVILGLHEYEKDGADVLAIRTFYPGAKRITLTDPADETFICELEQIHEDGFFEKVITERSKWFRYKLKIEDYEANTWSTFDSYSFPRVLSELDLHLFGEGTHYQIYDKLGAHPKTLDGVEGVAFALWAPNAKRVSVIGEFNNWDGRRNQMRMLSNSGVWEIFIPGLVKYDKYKYEIKTSDGRILQKTDPYGNFAELRPSTASLIYDINNYKWKDSKWIKNRNENSPLAGPVNIYEVHLGSWKYKEDEDRFYSYVELADELVDYVKQMGYTHIELMPIEEFPFDGSWGYQVTGYYSPTSRYGNPEEFMYFIDKCHQNGIGVILDWVPAHFPKDAHGLAKFDGTALYEHEDPKKGEHPDWGTLIFNFGRKEVKNFLIANALFWIEKYHLDGLRVDAVASMLYLDYGKYDGQWISNEYGGRENTDAVELMKHMNSVILGKHPNIIMAAEESTAWAGVSRPVASGGLGYNLKWNMGWMNDFLSYIEKDPVHRKFHHSNLTFGMVYAYSENFVLVLSHDEVVHGKRSLIDKMPGDIWQKCANLRLSYSYMYGHPGKKLLFMGSEFGHFREWSEAKQMDWFLLEYKHHAQIKLFVRDLNELYKNERAFWYDDFKGTGFEWVNCGDWERSTLSFIRKTNKAEDTLLFVCNFTPVPILSQKVGVPHAGMYTEILNSDSEEYGGGGVINSSALITENSECDKRDYNITVDIPPLGAAIFKYKKA